MPENPQPPMTLGDVLDYPDFRRAAHTLLTRRTKAIQNYQEQANVTAEKEAAYQRLKARRYIEIKNTGGVDGGMVAAAEAGERIKGDDEVSAALIDRDLHRELLRARREDISGIDEALATLRRVGEWSQALEMRGAA